MCVLECFERDGALVPITCLDFVELKSVVQDELLRNSRVNYMALNRASAKHRDGFACFSSAVVEIETVGVKS